LTKDAEFRIVKSVGVQADRNEKTMSTKIVIIPCGGAKLETPAPARDLYTGSMFRDTLTTARAMTTENNIYILSALHGLIALDQIVEPYDLKMGQRGSVQTTTLETQLASILPRTESFVIDALLPKAYNEALENACPHWIENHFTGTKGIGYQKQVLKTIREKVGA
jgi:cytoplasmic iron level regulating protein YaaA (DUF328/UPF0246 family)